MVSPSPPAEVQSIQCWRSVNVNPLSFQDCLLGPIAQQWLQRSPVERRRGGEGEGGGGEGSSKRSLVDFNA